VEEQYLSTEDACKYLNVSYSTLHRYVRQHRLIRYRKGFNRSDWYLKAELDDIIRLRPVEPVEQKPVGEENS